MRPIPAFPRSRGFSLLEVLLALGLALLVGTLAITKVKRDAETTQAQAAGQQMVQIAGALNQYIGLYFPKITAATAANPATSITDSGTADDPGPRYCTHLGDTGNIGYCNITTDTLRLAGLLPASFTSQNVFGSGYSIMIRVQSPGSAVVYAVDGMVATQTPYLAGSTTPRFDLLGEAVMTAGADAGMVRVTPSAGTVLFEGLNGGWTESGFSTQMAGISGQTVTSAGLLGVRAGFGSGGYAAFLRLDGGNAMTGDLRINNNSLVIGANAAEQVKMTVGPASATNPATLAGTVRFSKAADAAGAYTANIQSGNIYSSGSLEAGYGTSGGGKLYLDNSSTVNSISNAASTPSLIGTTSNSSRPAIATGTGVDLMSGSTADVLSSQDVKANRYFTFLNPNGSAPTQVALHSGCSSALTKSLAFTGNQVVQCQQTIDSLGAYSYTWESFTTPKKYQYATSGAAASGLRTAPCPAGTTLLSGGFSLTGTGVPTYNGPVAGLPATWGATQGSQGWTASFPSGTTGVAYALCQQLF